MRAIQGRAHTCVLILNHTGCVKTEIDALDSNLPDVMTKSLGSDPRTWEHSRECLRPHRYRASLWQLLGRTPGPQVRVEGFWIEPAYPFLKSAPLREVTSLSSRRDAGPPGLEFLPQIKHENAADFCNGLGVLVCGVT